MADKLSDYGRFIHKSRYARYLETEQRRESWEETVARLMVYVQSKVPELTTDPIYKDKLTELHNAILNLSLIHI